MAMPAYEVTAKVWRYHGKGGWHFVALPVEVADELAPRHAHEHRAFGALRVRPSLGSTTWTTSLFKDTRTASYLLPVKAAVRNRERIGDGDPVTIRIELEC
jgi:hypothetical protein